MLRRKTVIAVIVVLILAIAGFAALYVYKAKQEKIKIAGSFTLGTANTEVSWGIFIADELKFFAESGLNVTLRPFETGLAAYTAMLQGDVDVSLPSEFVIVGGAVRQNKIRVISTIVKADFFTLTGRRDHGVAKASDLAGKRIGLARNTIEEFFLGRILDLQGMNINDVTVVDMTFSAVAGAIREGVVDAVVAIPPYSDSIKNTFGARVAEWSAQSGQSLFGVLTSSDAWIARNPDLVIRLLKAVEQANMYIARHPEEAKAILAKRLNLDAASVERAGQRNRFSLSLDQSLVVAMEDEARWMIRNNLTPEKTIPDFIKYIYLDGLKAVRPEAVSIIH